MFLLSVESVVIPISGKWWEFINLEEEGGAWGNGMEIGICCGSWWELLAEGVSDGESQKPMDLVTVVSLIGSGGDWGEGGLEVEFVR